MLCNKTSIEPIFTTLLLGLALSATSWGDIPLWVRQEQMLQACQKGDTPAVRKALKQGISPTIRDRFDQPAVLRAVRSAHTRNATGMIATLTALKEGGANLNEANQYGTTPIFLTVPNNVHDPASVYHYLLEQGVSAEQKDGSGLTPLQRPVFYDHAKLDPTTVFWRLLVEGDLANARKCPKLNEQTPCKTVAMALAYYGEESALKDLIIYSSPDLSIADEQGENVIFYAATSGSYQCLNWMDSELGLLDSVNKLGETPLIRACQFGHNYFIQRLLRRGVNADRRDKTGRSALHYAAEYGDPVAIVTLLARANSELELSDGRTALMLAVQNKHPQAVKAFVVTKLSAGTPEAKQEPALAKKLASIQLDHQDKEGRTALMLAVQLGERESVETLLQGGCNRQLKNRKGETALDLARSTKQTELIKLLSQLTK